MNPSGHSTPASVSAPCSSEAPPTSTLIPTGHSSVFCHVCELSRNQAPPLPPSSALPLPVQAPPLPPSSALPLPVQAPPLPPSSALLLPEQAPPLPPSSALLLPVEAPPLPPSSALLLPVQAPPLPPSSALLLPEQAPPLPPSSALLLPVQAPPLPPSSALPLPLPSPGPGASRSSVDSSPDLDCSICFSQFNNGFRCPKMLRCRHTFCLECLARINVKSSEPSAVQCPLCRCSTPLPALGPPGLATDRTVLSRLPDAMQRVYSIRFVRNKGKLQVNRSEGHWGWRQRSLDPSLDVGIPSPPAVPDRRFIICIILLTGYIFVFLYTVINHRTGPPPGDAIQQKDRPEHRGEPANIP